MLDAMERARLLRDLKVRVGDVRGSEEVGHVALGTGANIRRLERGRLYIHLDWFIRSCVLGTVTKQRTGWPLG